MDSDDKSLAIDEIAAAIAHEVKNPISLVRANIDILARDVSSSVYEKNFSMIRRELDKINDIIMDFIHLTEHREALEWDIIYVYDILEKLTGDLLTACPAGLNINLKCEDKNFSVYGSEKSIAVLFRNILKNALEAMDYTGLITIDVYKNDGQLKIKIKDTGKGFSKDIEDKLFNDYFTTKSGGSGLGLSICKKIASEHNGSFTLKGSPGGGCIATVSLPVCEE